MGYKTRSNYQLSGKLTQDQWNRIFKNRGEDDKKNKKKKQ